jgi:hypothetical protein
VYSIDFSVNHVDMPIFLLERRKMSIIRRRKTSEYAQIFNVGLQSMDDLPSIGMLAHLMSLPEDWIIIKEQLSDKFSRRAVDNSFNYLMQKGYLLGGYGYGAKEVKGGKMKVVKQYEYIISDIPFDAEEITDFYLSLCEKWTKVQLDDNNFSTVQNVQYSLYSTKRTATKKDIKKNGLQKGTEEEEVLTTVVTESMVTSFANQLIKEREIENQKTITAIHSASITCKAIGTDKVDSMKAFVTMVVEDKMSKLGQKQKQGTTRKGRGKATRTEIVPEWMKDNPNPEEIEKAVVIGTDAEIEMYKSLAQYGNAEAIAKLEAMGINI